MRLSFALALAMPVLLVTTASVHAATDVRLDVRVGPEGAGLAVASLHSPESAARLRPMRAVMDQRERQFHPRVLWVTAGSEVRFPNSDDIRHHVYSFSAARRFELPLYSGSEASPISFPEPGLVVLGCNIHDWMSAHILVLDTPHAAVADADGRIELSAPPGSYRLRLWHPRLDGVDDWLEEPIELAVDAALTLERPLQLKPEEPPPLSEDERLRALQERFRALRTREGGAN
jgi:plastocyanin